MRPKIAFVAEDPDRLEQVRGAVQGMEHEWEISYFGVPAAALSTFEKNPVQVLVCDAAMTSMDSLSYCKIHADRNRQHTRPVFCIYLTNQYSAKLATAALDAGIDDIIDQASLAPQLVARIKLGLRLVASQRALFKTRAQLIRLNIADSMTGLYNQRHAQDIIDVEMARVRRGKQQLSLVCLTVVNFEKVKKFYGDEAAGTLLDEVASRLQQASRQYDMLARWSSDELLVICPHTNFKEVTTAAKRFQEAISDQAFRLGDGTILSVTASLGTASTDVFPESDGEELVQLALEAMCEAEQSSSSIVAASTIVLNKTDVCEYKE